jgi:hypothetical protein
MASPTQLAAQIRFTLETLAEANDHRTFERICVGLARRRIVSNLLPATGPVSAGGDQGRDAESHWTDLPNEGATSWFSLLASTERVALACTIQKSDGAAKIRRDLSAIAESGNEIRRVIYFTVTAVPVAQRHQLQSHASDTHGIDLDIWDAQGIAHNLADQTCSIWPSTICTFPPNWPPSLPSPNQIYRSGTSTSSPNGVAEPDSQDSLVKSSRCVSRYAMPPRTAKPMATSRTGSASLMSFEAPSAMAKQRGASTTRSSTRPYMDKTP